MKRRRWTRTCVLHSIGIALVLWSGTTLSLRAQTPPPEILVDTKLVTSEEGAAEQFGSALAVSGDVLVTTAPFAVVDGRQSAGAAYIFLRDPATQAWTEYKKLLPHDGAAFDQFGIHVAIDQETVAVGAPNADVRGTFQQGAVYIFQRHQGGTDNWGEVVKLTDDSVGSGGHFGSAIAIKGDLLVVGASEGRSRRGQVTLFERNRGSTDAWGVVTTISYSAVGDSGNVGSFGSGVALDGDLLLIGAANTSVSYVNEADGAAYLFRRAVDDRHRWDYVTRLITPGADRCVKGLLVSQIWLESAEFREEALRCATEESQTDNDDFGYAVALGGDIAVVGARFAEGAEAHSSNGAAYVFQRDPIQTDRWNEIAKLAPADTSASAFFGSALALAGDTVVVGAHGADIGDKVGQGAAYVFKRDQGAPGAWGEVEKLLASDGLSDGHFGTAVALDGEVKLIGAKGADEWRGAVYVRVSPGAPPSAEVCRPPFALTGELVNDNVVSNPAGVLLGAVANTLAKPLPVWIHEVPAPPEPLLADAVPLGAFYSIGGECTTFAPHEAPFALALPVPDGADTSRLGAVALVSAEYLLDGPASGRFWQPVIGTYDPTRRLYMVTLDALAGEGSTFVLVTDPSAEPDPSESRERVQEPRSASSGEDDTPTFVVRCFGLIDPEKKVCSLKHKQIIRDALVAAYNKYKRQGFLPPALDNKKVALNADSKFEITENPLSYEGIYIRLAADPACQQFGGQRGGFYSPLEGSISLCIDEAAILSDKVLDAHAHHELFHAVQFNYPNVRSQPRGDWVLEGMAEAAVNSEELMHRWPKCNLRRVDVPLTQPRGAPGTVEANYPYQVQDFWVYLFQVNNRALPLGELASFLVRGASIEAVAEQLASPPSSFYFGLGREYWAWAKNQVIEKTVDLDGALQNPCVLEHAWIGRAANDAADFSWPVSDHVNGSLESLQSKLAKIEFTTAASDITITAEGGGGESVLAYKVYLDGETDCADPTKHPDGKRTFASLPQGSIVYVVLANMQYDDEVAAPLFVVRVLGG